MQVDTEISQRHFHRCQLPFLHVQMIDLGSHQLLKLACFNFQATVLSGLSPVSLIELMG